MRLPSLALLATGVVSFYGRWRMRRAMSGLAMAAGLIFVAAILVGILIVAGFCAAYAALVQYGFDSVQSALIIAGAALVLSLLCALLTRVCVRRARMSIPARTTNRTIDAFFEGLMARP